MGRAPFPPTEPMTSINWRVIQAYCDELAPVIGPFLEQVSAVAVAISRSNERASLQSSAISLTEDSD